MADHADRRRQPSQLHRTLECPGWVNQCEAQGIAPKPSGPDAQKGSAAHYLGQRCIEKDKEPDHLLGKLITIKDDGKVISIPCDEAMVEGVEVYVNEIRRKRSVLIGATFLVEEKLDLDWLVPGMFGTGDHIAIEPFYRLNVDDYKNGYISVEVEDNPALMAYALGALGKDNLHSIEEVTSTIIQPNAPHSDGPIRSIVYEVEQLYQWGYDVLVPGIKLAQSPDAPLKTGDWCKWCDAQVSKDSSCPQIRKDMFEVADVPHNPETLLPAKNVIFPLASKLGAEQLDRLLEFAAVFEDFLGNVRDEAYSRLEQRDDDRPTEWKLIAGKLANRTWGKTEKQVYDAVKTMLARKDVFVSKVLSPAQLEKALKKANQDITVIEKLLAERKPGKPRMVPADHKSPEFVAAKAMFE